MSRNPIKVLLVIIVLSQLTSPARKLDVSQSRSILDYYFLLPHQYLPFLLIDSRVVREKAIQIKDLDAGFLKSGESTEEVALTLALPTYKGKFQKVTPPTEVGGLVQILSTTTHAHES